MDIQNTSICCWCRQVAEQVAEEAWERRRGGEEAWERRRASGGVGEEAGGDLDDNISGVEVEEGKASGLQPVYHHPNTRQNLNCRDPLHP
jgi:hypothetical protein